jgi:hypothetical protein
MLQIPGKQVTSSFGFCAPQYAFSHSTSSVPSEEMEWEEIQIKVTLRTNPNTHGKTDTNQPTKDAQLRILSTWQFLEI